MNFAALVVAGAFAAAAPNAAIVSGPSGASTLTNPTFEFAASGSAASFECSVDGAGFQACASPMSIGPLALGPHTFSVRGIGPDGTADPEPATRSWDVVASPVAFATVKLSQPTKRIRLKSFKRISGLASSPSGVSSVYVALQSGGPDKSVFPPGCVYTNLRSGQLVEQPCLLPNYTKVSGTQQWSYRLPAKVRRSLRPGTYKLIVRAFNGFSQALRHDFKIVVR